MFSFFYSSLFSSSTSKESDLVKSFDLTKSEDLTTDVFELVDISETNRITSVCVFPPQKKSVIVAVKKQRDCTEKKKVTREKEYRAQNATHCCCFKDKFINNQKKYFEPKFKIRQNYSSRTSQHIPRNIY